MNKLAKLIYMGIMIAAFCVPGALYPFFHSDKAVGKEKRQEVPSLIEDGGINSGFSDDFNLWFAQNMPFRPEAITAYNLICSGVLQRPANNVIVGSSGQLFYAEEKDQYIGKKMTERELHNTARTIWLISRYCKLNGAQFSFMCVPDKSTIYSEQMPAGYIRGESSDIDDIEKYFREWGVDYADIEALFLEHKTDKEELYLRDDSHWTNYGALLAYNNLRRSMGHNNDYSVSGYEIRQDWQGDLSEMIYPEYPLFCNQYYYNLPENPSRFIKPRKAGMTKQDILADVMSGSESMDTLIRTVNPKGRGRAYITRDSFFRALLPYAIDSYAGTYITRFRGIDLRNIQSDGYTEVIYETAERNLPKLTRDVPMIYAVSSEKDPQAEYIKTQPEVFKTEKNEGEWYLYGLLDSSEVKPKDNIFIRVSKNGTDKYYEAVPVTDSSRLTENSGSSYGFTAFIKTEDIEDSDVSVVLERNK